MAENQSESAKFLNELGIEETKQESNLETPVAEPELPREDEPAKPDQGFAAKNRRERRLMEQNQHLREEAIASQARLEAISEAQKARETTQEAEYLKLVERIYGTDTPEKREATEILKKGLQSAEERAYQRALDAFESKLDERETAESHAVQREEATLESDEAYLEDERQADFTDDDFRNRYYTTLERMSRKDGDGNIIEYADPDAVMDYLEATTRRDNSRAKELASRNMVRGGQSQPSTLEDDSAWRELRRLGIF